MARIKSFVVAIVTLFPALCLAVPGTSGIRGTRPAILHQPHWDWWFIGAIAAVAVVVGIVVLFMKSATVGKWAGGFGAGVGSLLLFKALGEVLELGGVWPASAGLFFVLAFLVTIVIVPTKLGFLGGQNWIEPMLTVIIGFAAVIAMFVGGKQIAAWLVACAIGNLLLWLLELLHGRVQLLWVYVPALVAGLWAMAALGSGLG